MFIVLLILWNRDPFCPEACEGAEVVVVARWGKSWLFFTNVHVSLYGYTLHVLLWSILDSLLKFGVNIDLVVSFNIWNVKSKLWTSLIASKLRYWSSREFVNTWVAIFSDVSERVADIKTRIYAMNHMWWFAIAHRTRSWFLNGLLCFLWVFSYCSCAIVTLGGACSLSIWMFSHSFASVLKNLLSL